MKLAYSETEAAKLVDVGRTKIREEIRDGQLKARRVGKRVIIPDDDLRTWLIDLPPVKPAA